MTDITITVLKSLKEIEQADWDNCACSEEKRGLRAIDPFTTYRFLYALEVSKSVGEGTGWIPCHLVAKLRSEIIAVLPLYAKSHSQGEYIFDYAWANAYANAGGRYYPKLQSSVPFTPVTGKRFLVRSGYEDQGTEALVAGLISFAKQNKISSSHITFCTVDEAESLAGSELLLRETIQFHWEDKGFGDFDGFLSSLSSRKRKSIKRERKTANSFGNGLGKIVTLTGDEIKDYHWDFFWEFYQDTGNRKWGTPYLTREFFDLVHKNMRNDILLILALNDKKPIAGAMNFIGQKTLFGRYWGALEDHSCLHYELCYYQAIEYALLNNIKCIEAGAQGDHKLARGYLPSKVYSLHWFNDHAFGDAVRAYLKEERNLVSNDSEFLFKGSPFKIKEREK